MDECNSNISKLINIDLIDEYVGIDTGIYGKYRVYKR